VRVREREGERERDRESLRHRQTDRQRQRETNRQTKRKTDRQTDRRRQTETETGTETERQTGTLSLARVLSLILASINGASRSAVLSLYIYVHYMDRYTTVPGHTRTWNNLISFVMLPNQLRRPSANSGAMPQALQARVMVVVAEAGLVSATSDEHGGTPTPLRVEQDTIHSKESLACRSSKEMLMHEEVLGTTYLPGPWIPAGMRACRHRCVCACVRARLIVSTRARKGWHQLSLKGGTYTESADSSACVSLRTPPPSTPAHTFSLALSLAPVSSCPRYLPPFHTHPHFLSHTHTLSRTCVMMPWSCSMAILVLSLQTCETSQQIPVKPQWQYSPSTHAILTQKPDTHTQGGRKGRGGWAEGGGKGKGEDSF